MGLFSLFKELFMKMFIVTLMQNLNTPKCITRYWIRHYLYKSIGGLSQYILLSSNSWYTLSSSILKNEGNVSSGFLKLVYVWFLSMTVQLSLSFSLSTTVQYQLRLHERMIQSLGGIPISSSLPNFEMFACSPTLVSRFSHFISKRGCFR